VDLQVAHILVLPNLPRFLCGILLLLLDKGYSVREALPLPSKPPYTVHLGNMSFDATEGDIQDFFSGCQVTSVRIVEDKIERKPKGFGYAEFATLEGLKKALEYNGTQFQGRNIRVSVAEPRMLCPQLLRSGRELTTRPYRKRSARCARH
jgi:translation initiation factor 4B